MKKLILFSLFAVSSLLFWECTKEETSKSAIVAPQHSDFNPAFLVDDRSCILLPDVVGVPGFPAYPTSFAPIGTTAPYYRIGGVANNASYVVNMSRMYKARLYTALYRLYGNLKVAYFATTPNAVSSQEWMDFSRMSANYPNLGTIDEAFKMSKTGTTNFDKIKIFMDYAVDPNFLGAHGLVLSPTECDNLINVSTGWNAVGVTDTTGSYTIIFNSANFYVGKGNKERCRTSAKERCMNAPGGMDNGNWGDFQQCYIYRPSTVSASDQGFKEEAIKIHALGGVNNSAPNSPGFSPYSYNKNNSPGLSKINSSSLGY